MKKNVPAAPLSQRERLLQLLAQGTIYALAVFGCLFSFLSCFSIPVHTWWLVYAAVVVLPLLFVFLTRKKGWIGLLLSSLAVLLLGVIRGEKLLEGSLHLLNIIFTRYEQKSTFSFISFPESAYSAAVWQTQTTLTVLFFFFFVAAAVGFFVIRRPSVLGLVVTTAPFVMAGLFFTLPPAMPAFCCLLAAYFMLYVSRCHTIRRRKNKPRRLVFVSLSARNLLALSALPVVLLAVFCTSLLVPAQNYQRPAAADRLQEVVTTMDFGRLLNTTRSGLGKGDLRNLGNFRFTGETVLKIKSSEEFDGYLRGYAGTVFTGSSWEPAPAETYERASAGFSALNPQNFNAAMQTLTKQNLFPTTISIRNSPAEQALFIPAGLATPATAWGNARFVQDTAAETAAVGGVSEYTLRFFTMPHSFNSLPCIGPDENIQDIYQSCVRDLPDLRSAQNYSSSWQIPEGIGDPSSFLIEGDFGNISLKDFWIAQSAYQDYVYDTYTALPSETAAAAAALCSQYGLAPVITNTWGTDAYSLDVEATCQQVQNLLESRCTYSYTPPQIPSNADFSTYFLNESRQGYCVHFATTAAVLLRSMGIPARYAEGFSIVGSDYLRKRGEDGYVSISDKRAHAWVEVYDPFQMEWIPLEVTPNYDENEGIQLPESSNPPAAALDSSDKPASQNSSEPAVIGSADVPSGISVSFKSNVSGLWIVLGVLAAALLLLLCALVSRRAAFNRCRRSLSQQDPSAAVLAGCRRVLRLLRLAGCALPGNADTPQAYAQAAAQKLPWLDGEQLRLTLACAQKARFSKQGCTEAERQTVSRFLDAFVRDCCRKLPRTRRLLLRCLTSPRWWRKR